jgi:uncharacterized protein (TIGR03435 family)
MFRRRLAVALVAGSLIATATIAQENTVPGGTDSSAAAAATPLPRFDVASVKLADPKGGGAIGLFTYPGGRIRCSRCSLQYLLMEAFKVESHQIWGGPSWINETAFDVEAKPPATSQSIQSNPTSIKSPPNQEQRQMLQALLIDRFQLKFHRETTQDEGYALVRGDKPLKLEPPKDPTAFSWAGSVQGGMFGHGIAGTNISMAQLATRLSAALRRPVVDKTGISGSYDFRYEDPADDSNTNDISTIFLSLQKIGLNLKSVKTPMQTVVIDQADLPSPN